VRARTARISQFDRTMPHTKQLSLILGNATRLLNDARLLVDHHRYASAFALAVLGVEEIGKALIKDWEVNKPLAKSKEWQSLHVRKQTAVASLLLGALTVRMFPSGVDGKTLDVDAVTKTFNESDEGHLFALIRDNNLERRKQGALYQDNDLLTSIEEEYAELHVGGVLKIASDAQQALANHAARAVARAFYEISLTNDDGDQTPK
jgi:AbiV family abortive infection protein